MPQNDKATLDERFLPDDVVAGMLYFYCAELDLNNFTGKKGKIHEAFFSMKQGHGDLLRRFNFTTDEKYPFSRMLEGVLSRLQLSRIIGMENPYFEKYEVKEKARVYLESIATKRFNEQERKELKEMAKAFSEKCKPQGTNQE